MVTLTPEERECNRLSFLEQASMRNTRDDKHELHEILKNKGWIITQPDWYEHPNYPSNNAITDEGKIQYIYSGPDSPDGHLEFVKEDQLVSI